MSVCLFVSFVILDLVKRSFGDRMFLAPSRLSCEASNCGDIRTLSEYALTVYKRLKGLWQLWIVR